MIGGLNPKKMQAIMKQMGMSQEDIDAEKVIIEKTDGSKIIINQPQVARIKIQGQENFQISGQIREESGFSEQDIETIIEKTGCSKEQAKNTLEETGDLAEAILKLTE